MRKRDLVLIAVILILSIFIYWIIQKQTNPTFVNAYSPEQSECSDGIDNDGDGFSDILDLGCSNEGDNTENSEGYGAGVKHCREDFSLIDGNVIRNPYFACDELTQYGSDPPEDGTDNIPDYWGVQYPMGVWYIRNHTTHEHSWFRDESIPTLSKKLSLINLEKSGWAFFLHLATWIGRMEYNNLINLFFLQEDGTNLSVF